MAQRVHGRGCRWTNSRVFDNPSCRLGMDANPALLCYCY
jgi:hypothetical protein